MEEMKDLVNKNLVKMSEQGDSAPSKERLGKSVQWLRTEQVVLRLGNIYGHLFTSLHKTDEALDSMIDEWCDSIGHHSYAQQTRVINRCKEEYKKPPSLPEFMELFKYTQEQALNAGRLDNNTPRLEHKSDPKVGKEEIKKMFEGLET